MAILVRNPESESIGIVVVWDGQDLTKEDKGIHRSRGGTELEERHDNEEDNDGYEFHHDIEEPVISSVAFYT